MSSGFHAFVLIVVLCLFCILPAIFAPPVKEADLMMQSCHRWAHAHHGYVAEMKTAYEQKQCHVILPSGEIRLFYDRTNANTPFMIIP